MIAIPTIKALSLGSTAIAETHFLLEHRLPEFGEVANGHIKNVKKDLKRSPSTTCFPLAVAVFGPDGNLNGK